MKSTVEILKDLVAINSINPKCQADGPGEAECERYVADLFRKNSIDFELQEVLPGRHNVVARVDGRDKSSGAVVGEATELDVIIAHKSAVRWRTTIHGRAAHTSRPDLGINAISKAVKLVAMVERDWIPRVRSRTHPILGPGEMTVSLDGVICRPFVPSLMQKSLRSLTPMQNEENNWRPSFGFPVSVKRWTKSVPWTTSMPLMW